LPGRINIKSGSPLIIWDAAHNEDKMCALVDTIDQTTQGSILLLLAFKKGQNADRLLKPLGRLSKRIRTVILTKYKVVQDIQVESEDVLTYIDKVKSILPYSQIELVTDCKSAYQQLRRQQGPAEMLVVTGSFYLLNALEEK